MSNGSRVQRVQRCTIGVLGAAIMLSAGASGASAKPHSSPLSVPNVGAAVAPAKAGPKLLVSGLSDPPRGTKPGDRLTLHGTVTNDGTASGAGPVTVILTRYGSRPATIGSTQVVVAPGKTARYQVVVTIPKVLPDGTYSVNGCAAKGGNPRDTTCVTAPGTIVVGKADPVLGTRVARASTRSAASAQRAAETCTPGSRTLSNPGDRVYPEEGNGGYKSVHTDLNLIYDADTNQFLPGNNVELTQTSTQCLSDFSLDFEPTNTDTAEGPNLTISSITIDGQPATYTFKQPTYPGNPNGPDDPDPNAHLKGLVNPISATINVPPACSPNSTSASEIGQPCPATKLVITPATPIPSGTTFKVKVSYTGRPGLHTDADGATEGWFRVNNPTNDGSFVTTEPIGAMAWMPLNNHPTAKPTYDSYNTTQKNRVVAANGENAGFVDNPPDANFPNGSRTTHWHSPAPIANYLVTNNIGTYEANTFVGTNGLVFNQYQGSGISPTQKTANLAIMNTQNTITDFQKRMNGAYPFTTNGVVIALPSVSFEEEMQTMIAFQGGRISQGTFVHENMHQWWGDNVAEASFNLTALKEGFATLGEYLWNARTAAINAGGTPAQDGLDTPAGQAAFETSLTNRFNSNYGTNSSSFWTSAPSNPTAANLFASSSTYTRSATAYLAMRAILGGTRMNQAMTSIQTKYAGGNFSRTSFVEEFKAFLPNQSQTCKNRVDLWAAQWFDTAYPSGNANTTGNRPQITGPGVNGPSLYSVPGCSTNTPPTTTPSYSAAPVNGTYTNPAVTLTAAASGANPAPASTTYTIDGGAAKTYSAPFPVTGDGNHTLTFATTDADGNLEPTKTVTLRVATPPVTTATVNPVLVNGAASTQATVTLSATDDTGVASTQYRLDDGDWTTYSAPFTVTSGGAHTVLYRSTDTNGNVEATQTLSFTINPTGTVTVTGNVPGTLALTVGPAASLGSFLPGVGQDYGASVAANVTSSAAASVLTVQDPSTTAPGRLVNGAAALPQPLKVSAANAANPTATFAPLSGNAPLTLLTYGGPVSNDPVTIGFKQSIAATDALRTGTYGKTVVFTLSATTP